MEREMFRVTVCYRHDDNSPRVAKLVTFKFYETAISSWMPQVENESFQFR